VGFLLIHEITACPSALGYLLITCSR